MPSTTGPSQKKKKKKKSPSYYYYYYYYCCCYCICCHYSHAAANNCNVAMILGIGHDIVHLPRFVSLLHTRSHRRVARLAQRVLHPVYERPQFDAALAAAAAAAATTNVSDKVAGGKNKELVRAAHLLANAWACKEALYKALDETDQPDCRFNAWYKHKPGTNKTTTTTRTTRNTGKPAIACDAYAAAHPAETFWLSVSHDGDYLTAFVVREGKSLQ